MIGKTVRKDDLRETDVTTVTIALEWSVEKNKCVWGGWGANPDMAVYPPTHTHTLYTSKQTKNL